jgi:hypothetical protein
MAKTLWPMGTIVCFDGFEEMPYRLLDRVTEGHTKYIPVLDIESMEIEWTKLDELKYLDKPETYKEYYYAVRRKNSKTIRRTKGTTYIYRGRSSKESPEGEQSSRDESPQGTS